MATSKRRGRGAGALEFISLDGLRFDGRRAHEVRKIRAALGALSRADGSAYYEQGNTRVLAAVYGPRETGQQASNSSDRIDVRCEFSTALFATASRRSGWKGDRRSVAMARIIANIFSGVILSRYTKSRIDIYIQILQDDGGVLSAAVNSATLALVNAGIPMSDLVVACSVGFVDNEHVIDVCNMEVSADRPQLVVAVLAHAGKVVSVELDSRLPNVKVLATAMSCATKGCMQIFHVLQHEITQYSLNLLDSRGLVAF